MTYQFKPSKHTGYKRNVKPSEALKGTPLSETPVLFISPDEMKNPVGFCYRNQIDRKDFLSLMSSGKIVVSKDGTPRQSELLSKEINTEILVQLEVEAAAAAKEARARCVEVEILGVSEVQGKSTYNPYGSGEETRKGTYIEKGVEYTVQHSTVRGVTDSTRSKRGMPPIDYESLQSEQD